MKEERNKKRNLVFLIVGVLTLLLAVVGATYAYFQAQTGDGQSTNVNVATGTTDNLTFTIADINVTDPSGEDATSKNIVDENNKEQDKENTELVINANATNFGQNGTSLADGVEATATLKANDTTKTASKSYNVFLVLDQNDLIHTIDDETPELILTIHEPGKGTEEYTKVVSNLNHHDKNGDNAKDISGYDITGKRDVIKIAKDYPISVDGTEDGSSLTTTQTWKVQVTLVNLDKDQNKNTGKSVTGKVIITTEEDIKLSNINTLDIERADTSITATAITEDNENISKYYFKIDGGTPIATVALEDNDGWEEETSSTHTFGSLSENTEYTISTYGVDNNGFKTNVYETKIATGEGEIPKITKVEATETTYSSIKVSVTADGEMTNYEYSINGQEASTDSSAEHTFTGLKELTNYTITVVGIKGEEGEKTLPYIINVKTPKHITYADTCEEGKDGTSCQVAKQLVADAEKDTLIYHDGTIKDDNGNAIDAGDESYRFSGPSDIVNNYVCLDNSTASGEEQQTCDNADLYRIIGLFQNKEQQYEMKLIKADFATEEQLGTEGARNTGINYSSSSDKQYYKGALEEIPRYYWTSSENQANLWKGSALYETNLKGTFLTYLEEKLGATEENSPITTHDWITAGNTWSNIGTQTVATAYENEITNPNGGSLADYSDASDKSHNAKIGLMYVSDYGYAASQENWTRKLEYDSGNGYSNKAVTDNNWMYMGLYEWTITRRADSSDDAFLVYYTGSVSYGNGVYAVRPSFYLKSSTEIASGKGTKESPYRITWEGQV